MQVGVQSGASPTNLSRDHGLFVGRGREAAAIRAELAGGARLVTLVGPSGMGKTRLARRIAAAVLAEEAPPGGVWFCDLTQAQTPDDVLAVVGSTLSVPLARGTGDAGRLLGRALASRGPLLLVLDNLEHVVTEAGPLLATWLDLAPEAALLVTSQLRMHHPAEVCVELPPLDVEEAVALYEERARRAAGELPAADRDVLAELVQRLDGIPLAIELAAARARVLRPRQLLARLADRLSLLRDGRTGRHASLEEAIRFSWDLLEPWEASALAQCAAFADGFALEDAERVIVLRERDAPPLIDVLDALRDKSLLLLGSEEPPRFRLYESVQLYAQRQLASRGDEEQVFRRHAACFAELCAGHPDGGVPARLLQRVAAERENLLLAHRRTIELDPSLSTLCALAAHQVVAFTGPPASEAGVLDSVVLAARRSAEPSLLARALRVRAVGRIRHGRLQEARTDLEEAREAAAATGDESLIGHVRIEWGRLFLYGGELEECASVLREAVAIVERAGATFLEGHARNLLGGVEESLGALDEAGRQLELALELFRRCENRRFEGIALLNLGVVRYGQGRLEDGRALFERAGAIFEEVGDRASVADVGVNVGSIHLTAGRLDEAEALLVPALAAERIFGHRRFEALALGNLGVVAQERGQLHLARKYLQEALEIFRAASEARFHETFLPFFAAVEAALGLDAEAQADFAAAHAAPEELKDPGTLATLEVLEGFLDLARARANPAEAEAHVAAARARLDRRPSPDARTSEYAVAVRILAKACTAPVDRPSPASGPEPAFALRLGPEAAWFQPPGGEQVDLRRRGSMRRILGLLAEQRRIAPGVGLPQERLFEAGWPNERAHPTAAAARVYAAVRGLRTLGLQGILLRHADGYLLDPDLPVSRAS